LSLNIIYDSDEPILKKIVYICGM